MFFKSLRGRISPVPVTVLLIMSIAILSSGQAVTKRDQASTIYLSFFFFFLPLPPSLLYPPLLIPDG